MLARTASLARPLSLSMLFVATVAACGGKATPSPQAPQAPQSIGAPGPGASASTTFTFDGAPWTIAVAGTLAADADYGQRLATADFELTLMPWPRSEVFVQTASESIEAARREDPSAQVLHQQDGGASAFEIVVATGAKVDGSVLVPDPDGGDGVMCGFAVAPGADWQRPLAACRSVTRAVD